MKITIRILKIVANIVVSLLFVFAVPAFATLYQPGETLDPACAPTDLECGIVSTTVLVDTQLSATTSLPNIIALTGLILPATQLTNFGIPFYQFFSATTTDALTGGAANLYFTNARFDTRLAATTSLPNITTLAGLSLPATQLANFGTPFYQFFSATTTSALAEGVNLYFTNARADARINATSSIDTLTSAPNLATIGALSSGSIALGFGEISTDNVIIGTTVNGTIEINTGEGTGVQRIDSSGNLVNIGTITAAGLTSVADLAVSGTTELNDTFIGNGKVLIVGSYDADPEAPDNGTIFYDASTDKFKIVEGGTIKTICNLTDLGCDLGGGGISVIKEDNSSVITGAASIDFLGSDFNVSLDGVDEGDVAIDYTNSGITRRSQNETIAGLWTFQTASTTLLSANNVIYVGSTATTTIVGNNSTSTFAGPIAGVTSDLIVAGSNAGNLLLSPYSGLVGIGTTSPVEQLAVAGKLYVGGPGTSTIENNLIVRGTLQAGTASSFLSDAGLNTTGTIISSGAATSTFSGGISSAGLASSNGLVLTGGSLSMANISAILGTTTVANFTVANTSISTFAGGVQASTLNITASTATSTFANGIQLSGGCFRIADGSCLGGSGGGITGSGSSGQVTFWDGVSSISGDNSFFWDNSTSRLGLGSTTPSERLSVQGNTLISGNITSVANIFATGILSLTGITGTSTIASGQGFTVGASQLVVTGSNGNVGIGKDAPTRTFDVTGNWGGNAVVDNQKLTSSATITVSTKALVYHLALCNVSDTCSAGNGTSGATPTATFNITGLPDTDGTFAFIETQVQRIGVGGNPTENATIDIQINGTQVSTVTTTAANTNSAVIIENYIVVRTDGAWRVIGTPGTSDSADLAEWISFTGEQPEEGDLLSLADAPIKVQKSTSAYDSRLVGIVSTQPHTTMGQQTEDSIRLTLAGRVPVKVSTENGVISIGDYITSSSMAGVGMKATKAGRVVGRALESYSGEGIGLITVLVDFDYYEGGQLEDLIPGLDRVNSEMILYDSLRVDQIGSLGSKITLLNDVEFFGRPYFTTDTAGFAAVKAGEKIAEVVFEREYLEQPIVNVTITLNDTDENANLEELIFADDIRYLVIKKSVKGFTIILNKPAPRDMQFSWIVLAVKNAKIFESAAILPTADSGDSSTPNNPAPVDELPSQTTEAESSPLPETEVLPTVITTEPPPTPEPVTIDESQSQTTEAESSPLPETEILPADTTTESVLTPEPIIIDESPSQTTEADGQ